MFCVYRSLFCWHPEKKNPFFFQLTRANFLTKKRSWKVWLTWCPEPRSSMLGSKRVAGGRLTSKAVALGGQRPPRRVRPGGRRPCGGRPRRPEVLGQESKSLGPGCVWGAAWGSEKTWLSLGGRSN